MWALKIQYHFRGIEFFFMFPNRPEHQRRYKWYEEEASKTVIKSRRCPGIRTFTLDLCCFFQRVNKPLISVEVAPPCSRDQICGDHLWWQCWVTTTTITRTMTTTTTQQSHSSTPFCLLRTAQPKNNRNRFLVSVAVPQCCSSQNWNWEVDIE